MSNTSANSYWKANIKLVLSLLSVWVLISFVCGILLVDVLDTKQTAIKGVRVI